MGQQQIRKAPESRVEKKTPRWSEEEQLLKWEENHSRMLCLNARAKVWHVEGVTNYQISLLSQVRGAQSSRAAGFCFCFWFCFALLVFVLFQNEEVSLYGSRFKREWKEIGNTSTKVNLSPLKFISYSFGKIYLLWDIY